MRIAPAISAANRGLPAACHRDICSAGTRPFVGNRPRRPHDGAIDEAMSTRRASVLWLLVVIAITAIAVFVALAQGWCVRRARRRKRDDEELVGGEPAAHAVLRRLPADQHPGGVLRLRRKTIAGWASPDDPNRGEALVLRRLGGRVLCHSKGFARSASPVEASDRRDAADLEACSVRRYAPLVSRKLASAKRRPRSVTAAQRLAIATAWSFGRYQAWDHGCHRAAAAYRTRWPRPVPQLQFALAVDGYQRSSWAGRRPVRGQPRNGRAGTPTLTVERVRRSA